MKQSQRQVVKVIVNNRRPVARRRRTRRDMKQVEMPVNPYAMIPQSFQPPVRKNLEVGYNLYSKLAEQKREELKKTSDQLDDRATQLNNREVALNDAVTVADRSLDAREKNLSTIAEDLDLRFRTPTQTNITTPIYIGGGATGGAEAPSSSPVKATPPPKTMSPPTFATPPPQPSFKDALTGGAKAPPTPPQPPRVSMTPQSGTKQLKGELTGIQDTVAVYINSINNRQVLIRLLERYGEASVGTATLSQLKQLAKRVVKQRGTSASDLEAEIQTIQDTMRSGGGGGSAEKTKRK